MPSLRAAALSDIGRVRHENEDRFIFDEAGQVFGVADGVGGLPGGAEAAQCAVDTIASALRQRNDGAEPQLDDVVRSANEAVVELGNTINERMGIGTTLTFGCLCGDTLLIAHVGDSRAYLWRRGEFKRITEDHSVENEARQRRARGEVMFYSEANRNALTRCIGQPTALDVDVFRQPLAAGDRFLFCTDGVTRLIPDSELGSLLAKYDSPRAAVNDMVNLAVRRGGPDNATAVVVYVDAL